MRIFIYVIFVSLSIMNVLKRNDFVDIEFVAKIKSSGQIFDLTDEKLAKEVGIYDKNYPYGPKTICVGQKFVIKGLDESLIGKEVGVSYIVEINFKDAFGSKHKELIQVIPLSDLHDQKIKPFVGLKLQNNYGMTGNVRSVAGGRVLVDFNHPLVEKDLVYEVKILSLVTDPEKKLKSLLFYGLGLSHQYELKIDGNKRILKLNFEIPIKVVDNFKKLVKVVIPEIELEI